MWRFFLARNNSYIHTARKAKVTSKCEWGICNESEEEEAT